MEAVRIVWKDAGCEHSQMTLDEARQLTPMERVTVGLLLERNDNVTIVAFGQITDKDKEMVVYQDILVVPSHDVTLIQTLKE